VVALEYDPDATASARENLQANAVDQTVSLRQVDLTTATPPPPADIVCANLTGAVLCRLATQISACVVDAGALILGGLTTDEEVAVIDAFAASARLEESLREGEWSCLILRAHARESCTQ
jgi:ribosomal protein L11 methylase PrmA